jgi:molybdate transport system ATP-binding protein
VRFEIEARVRRAAGFALEVAIACEADALGLVGPSGSGKSTVLDCIAGLEGGARVRLDGEDLSAQPRHRRRVGYVFQDGLLFPHLDVRANLLYSPHAEALGAVPAALGIEHLLDRMPRNLSGGERRRVALARAILSRPRLLLLDEPFAGLDETRRREAMALVASLRDRFAIPMIVVSHVPEEIVGLTDRAVRLEAGRVAAEGPTATVLRAGETAIDNYLAGTVVGEHRVEVEGVELFAVLPAGARGEVRLACYARDVILAREQPGPVSARNRIETSVRAIETTDATAIVELERPRMRVALTTDAVLAMELAAGVRVIALIKATALTYLGPAA